MWIRKWILFGVLLQLSNANCPTNKKTKSVCSQCSFCLTANSKYHLKSNQKCDSRKCVVCNKLLQIPYCCAVQWPSDGGLGLQRCMAENLGEELEENYQIEEIEKIIFVANENMKNQSHPACEPIQPVDKTLWMVIGFFGFLTVVGFTIMVFYKRKMKMDSQLQREKRLNSSSFHQQCLIEENIKTGSYQRDSRTDSY